MILHLTLLLCMCFIVFQSNLKLENVAIANALQLETLYISSWYIKRHVIQVCTMFQRHGAIPG